MDDKYTLPTKTRIGHVHLKVADLQRSLDFYCGLLGFEIMQRIGNQAAFLSAGGYHHHIGLNTWYSLNGHAPAYSNTGLFHTAIVYPTKRDLALILKRLMDNKYELTGAADQGVSEAIYLNDLDLNGVELYWDKPTMLWPKLKDGSIDMYTKSLDIESLLNEIE